MFRVALMMGMSPFEFWHDDPELYCYYLEAYNLKKEAEAAEQNYYRWLQGMYFNYALAQNLQFSKSPKEIYPSKPFGKDILEEERGEDTLKKYMNDKYRMMNETKEAY